MSAWRASRLTLLPQADAARVHELILTRLTGSLIIAAYAAFVTTLIITT